MNQLHGHTNNSLDPHNSSAPWLFMGLLLALFTGLLPANYKLVVLVPFLASGAGVLLNRPYLALFVAILVCPFNFESLIARIGIPFVNPFNVAWLAAAVSLVLIGIRKRRFPIPRTSIDRVLVLNLTMSTIAIIRAWRLVPADNFPDVFLIYQQWVQWLVFFWITAGLIRTRNQARFVVLAVMVMIGVAGAFGIKDYISTRAVSGGAIERSQGLFGQANYAASFFAYYVPVVIAMAIGEGSRRLRFLYFAISVVGTVACVITFGRGGMMALAVAVVLVAAMMRSRTLIVLILIGAVLVLSDPTVRSRFAETTSDSGSDSVELDDSSGARLIAWRKALDLSSRQPIIGWGFLSFRHIRHPLDHVAAAQFGHGRMDVHNGHLNTLVSGGLLGLLTLYLQFGGIVVWGMRIRRNNCDPFVRALAAGLIASVVAIMIVNMFGTRLYDRQLVGYFWILLGVLHSAQGVRSEVVHRSKI